MVAPSHAPSSCAATYTGTLAHANLPMEARPMVTAGFKCAPLKLPTAYTATATPNAQPAVMTIHPAFWPLVLLSTTLVTAIAQDDQQHGAEEFCKERWHRVEWEAAKLSAGKRLVYTRLRA